MDRQFKKEQPEYSPLYVFAYIGILVILTIAISMGWKK